ncbi:MAG TPA: glycosyltransferase family 4 protein, partial [Candidatus Saccharimonadales bacterium]|nr:glycosyltransferase family 4 protein [Candidatus Saccharimonadales bacterium]
MKVLMLGWELPPHNSGGLGVACYQLCQALSGKALDLEFVLPYHSGESLDFMKLTAARPVGVQEILKSGIAYDSYKYTYEDGHEEWHDIFSQALLYEKAVEQMADSTEFDIVHAHDWLTFRAAMRLKLRTGCPIILHVHSIETDRAGGQRGNPWVHDIEEMAFLMADRILAVSDYTRRMIHREYGIPLDKIEVVHNSLDPTSVVPLDEDNTYRYLSTLKGQGYKVVTNVGRLTVQKGLPNLLRAARLVIERQPKTVFVIVGAGDQYEELIQLSAELGIGKHVIFTGFQRGKAWRDAFAIADLFVMPSVSEPFGLTPLEAAVYGAPSLISKQAGVGEILHSCLRVDFWDINEMANQMIATV